MWNNWGKLSLDKVVRGGFSQRGDLSWVEKQLHDHSKNTKDNQEARLGQMSRREIWDEPQKIGSAR